MRTFDSHGIVIPRGGENQCVPCNLLFGGLDGFDRHVQKGHAPPVALDMEPRDRGGVEVWVQEYKPATASPPAAQEDSGGRPDWWPEDWS